VAYPVKTNYLTQSNRFLGTRFHPDHVPADSDLATGRNPESAGTHMGFLIFSGFAGSAVGTVFFTLALKYGKPDRGKRGPETFSPLSQTLGAFLLFGDRLARQFFLYVASRSSPGVFVSVAYPTQIGVSFERAGLNVGTGYALICCIVLGLSTVAGTRCNGWHVTATRLSMRIVTGLVCMTLILLAYGKLNGAALWPEPRKRIQ